MATLTKEVTIQRRIQDGFFNREIRDAFYRTRRFLAGDESAIGGSCKVSISPINKRRKDNPNTPDFRILGHDEGVSNHCQHWLRTLVKQVLIKRPEMVFEALPPSVANFREAYLIDRLNRCHWLSELRTLLYSFMIDGFGVLKLGMSNDYPAVKFVDPLNVIWDIQEKFPHRWRFLAQELSLTYDVAVQELGQGVVDKIRANNPGKDDTGEDVIKVLEYWDNDTWAFVSCGANEVYKRKPNPFGFIPFEILHGDIFPSMLNPVPLVLHVLGTQVAHTAVQRSLINLAKKLTPVVQVNPKLYTQESYQRWAEGDTDDLSVLVFRDGITAEDAKIGVQVIDFRSDIPNALAIKRELDEAFVMGLGVNPYSAGTSINPEFAAETNAIQGLSGLNAQDITQELADFLGRCFRKLCRIGYLYDDLEFVYKVQSDLVVFGQDTPVDRLLMDDVYCEVSPGSFRSPQSEQLSIQQLSTTFLADPVIRQKYPQIVREIWERVLAFHNVRGIDQLLAPPDEDQQKLALLQDVPLETIQAVLQQLQAPESQPILPEAA